MEKMGMRAPRPKPEPVETPTLLGAVPPSPGKRDEKRYGWPALATPYRNVSFCTRILPISPT
jgi:hypothetical protein